jgi:hypothetical protein
MKHLQPRVEHLNPVAHLHIVKGLQGEDGVR